MSSPAANLMKGEPDYLFLEHVPNGHPLDFLYFNLGHTKAVERADLSIDPGSMTLVFYNSSYDIFLEKEKWVSSGQKILAYMLASDERVDTWRKKIESSLSHAADFNNALNEWDASDASDDALAARLDDLTNFQTALTFDNAEIVSDNYGTDLIQEELKATLQELHEDASSTIPILLEQSDELPFIAYENEIARYAIELLKMGVTDVSFAPLSSERIEAIVSKFDWIDANLNNPPKSVSEVLRDIQGLLDQGSALPEAFETQQEKKRAAVTARDALSNRLLAQANPRQCRVIAFATLSTRLGRMLVDEEMRSIFYSRKLYEKISSRLGVSLVELKYLSAEEIRDHLRTSSRPDKVAIQERMDLSIFTLTGDSVSIHTGSEALALKKHLDAAQSDADKSSDMRGEVAFGSSVVRGIARLVHDVRDMPKVRPGDILISSRTYPDLLPAMKRSAAIVSELGGLLSHAAIVARELKIPTIVGVRNAMSCINDGDVVEIDAVAGTVRKVE